MDQSLLILGAAYPDKTYDELSNFTLGSSNESIATLRRTMFGNYLGVQLNCPQCGERLELALNDQMFTALVEAKEGVVEVEGLQFRPVTLRDLAFVAADKDVEKAAIRLAKVCSLGPVEDYRWTNEFLEKVGQSLDRVDPAANVELALDCGCCHHAWNEIFDLTRFFWQEIEMRIQRLFIDVHCLASAYGWTEAEVLALDPERRKIYLGMVGA